MGQSAGRSGLMPLSKAFVRSEHKPPQVEIEFGLLIPFFAARNYFATLHFFHTSVCCHFLKVEGVGKSRQHLTAATGNL